jgi:hypothetical protein
MGGSGGASQGRGKGLHRQVQRQLLVHSAVTAATEGQGHGVAVAVAMAGRVSWAAADLDGIALDCRWWDSAVGTCVADMPDLTCIAHAVTTSSPRHWTVQTGGLSGKSCVFR